MKPGRKQIQSDPAKDPVWRQTPASVQATYKLNIMLAEMEVGIRNFEKAALYYLAALKTYFRTDTYQQTMQCIRQIPGSRQNKFLYKLGKCLLFHCHQSELAQVTLDKLSIMDPSFLSPVQKIFQNYEDENSSDRRKLAELIEKTAKTRKTSRTSVPSQVEKKEDRTTEKPAAAGIGIAVPDPEVESQDATESELLISFEETGEHFTVHKELTDSTTIDKDTLDDLMDSLLSSE